MLTFSLLAITGFTTTPITAIAVVGDDTTLFCDYPGLSSELWTRDEAVISVETASAICNCDLIVTGNSSTLSFTSVNSSDAGAYVCSVSIEGETCLNEATLYISGEFVDSLSKQSAVTVIVDNLRLNYQVSVLHIRIVACLLQMTSSLRIQTMLLCLREM